MYYEIINNESGKEDCITDGLTAEDAKKCAEDYYADKITNDYTYGTGLHEIDLIVRESDDDGNIISETPLKLEIDKERYFDGGDIGQRAFV